MQSQMSSPYFAQLMQQMQGGGMMNQPGQGGQQMPNMAPQLPMANPSQGAGQMGHLPTPQAPQQGFFGQMMGSPQGMMQGVQGLTGMGDMMSGIGSGVSGAGAAIPGMLNSMGAGNTAYGMLAASDAGAAAGGSSFLPALMALFA